MQENDGTVPKPIEGFIPNKAEGVERLVRAIRHVMIDHDLVDGDFADQVGVDQAAWSRIKNRTAEPGAKFLAGALRAFPELEREIVAYLKVRGTVVDSPTAVEETPIHESE